MFLCFLKKLIPFITIFPGLCTCTLLTSYPSGKHEHQPNMSIGSCRVKINSAICFNFSEEEMKAATNECRDDKVNFTMSSYFFSKMVWPKGIPGLINTVSTRKSYSCTLRFSSVDIRRGC